MPTKLDCLKKTLHSYRRVLIAFSGGVDSTFLLKVASSTLGKKNVHAVTAVGALYPAHEIIVAKKLARRIGVRHHIIKNTILQHKRFSTNPLDRCYVCKKNLFRKCFTLAKRLNIKVICDAANVDDYRQYRPGNRAAREMKVKRPLVKCGFCKKDIRAYSHRLKLPTWNTPALPCLATRFPYGMKLTSRALRMIDRGEALLRTRGLRVHRLRYCEGGVRIEVGQDEIRKFLQTSFRHNVVKQLKRVGFRYITLDLEGYRSGSMDAQFQQYRAIDLTRK